MLGVVITLAVIVAVAWCIFKNYYPPTVLLIAGLLFLAVAACFGVDPVPAKASTHFLGPHENTPPRSGSQHHVDCGLLVLHG